MVSDLRRFMRRRRGPQTRSRGARHCQRRALAVLCRSCRGFSLLLLSLSLLLLRFSFSLLTARLSLSLFGLGTFARIFARLGLCLSRLLLRSLCIGFSFGLRLLVRSPFCVDFRLLLTAQC